MDRFTSEMFLLPDGTPMDAADIADMLNNYKEPVRVPKSIEPIKTNYTICSYMNYPIRRERDTRGGYGVETFIESLSIPIYAENIVEKINNLITKHYRNNIIIECVAVGFDIFINLDKQLNEMRLIYPTVSDPSRNNIQIQTPIGPVLIYCSPNAGEIIPIFNDYHNIMRII